MSSISDVPQDVFPLARIAWYNSADNSKVACYSGKYEAIPAGADLRQYTFEASGRPAHPVTGAFQYTGLACSMNARTLVIDIDHAEHWPDNLQSLLPDTPTCYRDDIPSKQHHVVVVPAVLAIPELWPRQGGTPWGDVKSRGFSYDEGTHFSGARYVRTNQPYVIATRDLMLALVAETGLASDPSQDAGDKDADEIRAWWPDADEDYPEACGALLEEITDASSWNPGMPRWCRQIRTWAETDRVPGMSTLYDELVSVMEAGGKDTAREELDRALGRTYDVPAGAVNMDAWVGAMKERRLSSQGNPGGQGDVWDAHPVLSHIRQAAYARMVSPDAVLLCVLARVAAMRPYALNAYSYMPLSLNWATAIVGSSSSGKTTAERCADSLLPVTAARVHGWAHGHLVLPDEDGNTRFIVAGIGSGEGIIDLYRGMVSVRAVVQAGETDKGGRPAKIAKQVRHNAMLSADEGKAFIENGNKMAATLLPIFNTAWSGGKLSTANALANFREVEQYALGVVVGFQPAIMGDLLATGDLGTAQRFAFASPHDKTLPRVRPAFPGHLPVTYPSIATSEDGTPDKYMTFAPGIIEYCEDRRYLVATGQHAPDPLNGKHDEVRLRCAALLHLLCGLQGLEVGEDMWQLAGAVVDRSEAVRDGMAAGHREVEDGRDEAYADSIVSKIRQQHAAGKSAREIRMSLSKRARELFPSMEDVRAVTGEAAA
jgi:hypothetical protein